MIEAARSMGLEDALEVEADGFAELATTPVAAALVGVFLSTSCWPRKPRAGKRKPTSKIERAAVLGAGIMGGGIAYQSAYKGIPIKMKDIAQEGLDLGLSEANKLLAKRVARGRMTPDQMGAVLNSIDPTLTYDGFDEVDIVVEAVVENPKVKHACWPRLRSRSAKTRFSPPIPRPSPSLPGRSAGAPGKLLRHALLQPGTRHAPGGGHPR